MTVSANSLARVKLRVVPALPAQKATPEEAKDGLNNSKYMTPLTTAGAINVQAEDAEFTSEFDLPAPNVIRRKLSEQMSIVDFAGTASIGNGSLDAAVALQKAHDDFADAGFKAATLLVPPADVAYLLDSSSVFTDVAIKIKGLGQVYGPTGGGAMFKIANPGFDPLTFSGVFTRGAGLYDVGFVQDQPTVTTGWEPTAYPDIVKCSNMLGEFFLHGVFGLHVTQMFSSVRSGRAHIKNLRGQFLKRAIYIDNAQDKPNIDDVHSWPYWTTLGDVLAYQQENFDCIVMGRCDTPFVDNVFGIGGRSLLRFITTENGYTTLFHGGKFTADQSKYGIWIESDQFTGKFGSVTAQSEVWTGVGDTIDGGRSIYVSGDDARVSVGHLTAQRYKTHAIEVSGGNGRLVIADSELWAYNSSNTGSGAVVVNPTSVVEFTAHPKLLDAYGAPLMNAGSIGISGVLQNIPADAANEVRAYAVTTGQNARIAAIGSDTDVSLDITGQGTGDVNIPSLRHEAPGALATRSTAETRLNAEVSLTDYDLPPLDGTAHPLSERFATLGAAQAKYSWVTSLTQDRLDVAFQAAINDLPDRGGTVIVPPGNYAALTPANLTLPPLHSIPGGRKSHKVVQWRTNQADLPRGMPGVVQSLGNYRQPGTGGIEAGRFGDATVRYIVDNWTPDPTGVNQEDGVVVVQGSVPSTATATGESILAAFRFDLWSSSADENVALRGVHGGVYGDGGAAKLRAIRTWAQGQNGHKGVVTGAMFGALRTGVIPTEFGGNGVTEYTPGQAGNYGSSIDHAVVGQVGAGIRGCFIGISWDTVGAQPQTVFAQGYGNQAVKPTVAVADWHAGGTGHIIRVLADENATGGEAAAVYMLRRDGSINAKGGIRSSVSAPVIADDAVLILPIPRDCGILKLWGVNIDNVFGEWYFRWATTPGSGEILRASSTIASLVTGAAVGALTGTTGTDGRLNVSIYGQNLYIENRLGASRSVHYAWIS